MLQQFHRRTTRETGPARLSALRSAMATAGVDAFLVPRADAHRGETVAPCDERLAWLTGFSGSAGIAAITAERAVLFVDGRYSLQAAAEVDTGVFEIEREPESPLAGWLRDALPSGARVGYDPWLSAVGERQKLEADLADASIVLVPVDNLVDRVWLDRPGPPAAAITIYPDALAGRPSPEKREEVAADLRRRGLSAAVLTLPDSIAWLLNVRGSDIPRTPVALAFGIIGADGRLVLFVEPAKVGHPVVAHLGGGVRIEPPECFGRSLDALEGRVGLHKPTVPAWIADRLAAAGVEAVWIPEPCLLHKASKTPAELAGARAAHCRDGVAMATFLAWLDGAAPDGRLTEIDAVRRLEEARRATGRLYDIAFDTICGAGPNGAIVHYRVDETSNRPIRPGEILLVDSGGQYLDGTTDVTRTLAIGPPDPAAVRPFTLVLKGMIAMSRLRWPEGREGRELDTIARAALWSAGLDYDHGTGHGVGSFLGVHEGPQSLSRRGAEPLRPGMIVSNEPGYYREGAFGIRIENLLAVMPPETPKGGDRPMLGFETLTLVPIDTRLVDPALLGSEAVAWLNDYHARVLAALEAEVDAATRAWLASACAPI